VALGRLPRARERELLRVVGNLGGIDPKISAELARAEVLKWANDRVGGDLPERAWQGQSLEHYKGGRTCVIAALDEPHRSLWAMRVDDPDKTIAQRVWTTEIVLGYPPLGGAAMFSLRLLASSPEATLQVEPAVPGLVRQVSAVCGLAYGSTRFEPTPWVVDSDASAEALLEFLLDPARTVPALVCSIAEGASTTTVNTRDLVSATLGIARVVVLPARFTWVLTRALGKPLSVFNGAVRAYMPGLSLDANPFAHRLYLPDAARVKARAAEVETNLRWTAARESVSRLVLGEDALSFSQVRDGSLEIERARLQREGSTDSTQLQAAQAQIDALKDDLRRAEETQKWFSDEHKAAERRCEDVEQQLKSAQFRIEQLVGQIKARGDVPDAGVAMPESWPEFADWCDEALRGRVVLSARARRELKSAGFDDPAVAARCLLWLANEYRDSRIEGGTGDMRKAVESGIHNERCGADSFEFDWNGRRTMVEWHLKNGGNTRQPARCLRIYYLWDEATQQVVIVTMPAHVKTGAT
jgi:hypothetical protein